MPDTREEQIERKINIEVAGAVALASHPSGAVTIAPKSLTDLFEFAKLMAVSGPCVRAVFRGSPGACLAIAMQAFKWNADPFAVANKAYVTKNKAGEEQIAYEAQLIHSIVNTRAPLKRRLRPTYKGQGVKRSCLIQGWLNGEEEPFEYESPPIDQITVKNSPLWTADPDQQLFYYSTRAWARRHVPEILLGIYTPEEARGEIIDIEATEIPPRPRPEDYEETAQTEAPADASPPVATAEPPQPEPVKVQSTEADKLYVFWDQVGDQRAEFADWNEATAAYAEMLEAAAFTEQSLTAAWENGAQLLAELRERGHEQAADLVGKRYSELREELTKPAKPQDKTPAPAAEAFDVIIAYDPAADPRLWGDTAKKFIKGQMEGKRPPGDFVRFREANAAPLQRLFDQWRSVFRPIDEALKRGAAG